MKQNPINQAISSNLTIMEMHILNLLDNVQTARAHIEESKTDAAISAMMLSGECYDELKTLYNANLVIHRNSSLIHREED